MELRYEVDPALKGCPDGRQLRAMVAQALGSVPSPSLPHFQVTVRARQAQRGIYGELDWSSASRGRLGTRRFALPSLDCRELMATIAFALAVQLELSARDAASGGAEPPGPTWPADSARSDKVPPEPASVERKAAEPSDHKSADRRAAASSEHKTSERRTAELKPAEPSTTDEASRHGSTKSEPASAAGAQDATASPPSSTNNERPPTPPPANMDSTQGQNLGSNLDSTLGSTLGSNPGSSQPPAHSPLPWGLVAGAGPAFGLALAPHPIALGRVFLGLALGRALLELGAEASLPATLHDQGGAGFEDQLALGALAACGESLSIYLCAVGRLGAMRIRGVGLVRPFSPTGLLAQSGARLSYALALGHGLALLTHADALYLLSPWTVDVNGAATWKMPRFGIEAGVDLQIEFGGNRSPHRTIDPRGQ
ncbi:MAG: hypothetical protein ABSB49_03140 [Polyangia bacterium]